MRGTPMARFESIAALGIIPADAGNTHSHYLFATSEKDHPRGCGEHGDTDTISATSHGSSPRMRGTPAGFTIFWTWLRIIPADAGNTYKAGRRCSGRPDHPRGCGEHLPIDYKWFGRSGSSPRMRGTPQQVAHRVLGLGIIPADAGNTRLADRCHEDIRDHPRGCGEHGAKEKWMDDILGSSPRMRGTLLLLVDDLVEPRIIPADAGNTFLFRLPVFLS